MLDEQLKELRGALEKGGDFVLVGDGDKSDGRYSPQDEDGVMLDLDSLRAATSFAA